MNDSSRVFLSPPQLADLKRALDSSVRDYEIALMRNPTDAAEIRRCVDQCITARQRFKAATQQAKELLELAPES